MPTSKKRVQAFLTDELYESLTKYAETNQVSISQSVINLLESGLNFQKQEKSLDLSEYLTKKEFKETMDALIGRMNSNFQNIKNHLEKGKNKNTVEPENIFDLFFQAAGQLGSDSKETRDSNEKEIIEDEIIEKGLSINDNRNSKKEIINIREERKEDKKIIEESVNNSSSESLSESLDNSLDKSLEKDANKSNNELSNEPLEIKAKESSNDSLNEVSENKISKSFDKSLDDLEDEEIDDSLSDSDSKFIVTAIDESPSESLNESSLSYKLGIPKNSWFVCKPQKNGKFLYWDDSKFIKNLSKAKRYANTASCKRAVTRLTKKLDDHSIVSLSIGKIDETIK